MSKGKKKTDDMLVDFFEVMAMRDDMVSAAESMLSALAHMVQVCGVSEPVISELDVAITKAKDVPRFSAARKSKRKQRGRN